MFPQRLPQGGNILVEVVLLHQSIGPQLLQQLFFLQQTAGVLHKYAESLKYLQREGNFYSVPKQLVLGGVELERTEFIAIYRVRHTVQKKVTKKPACRK